MIRRRLVSVFLLASLLAATAGASSTAQAADDAPTFSATKTVTRDVLAPDGTVASTDSRDVTVTADVTQSLRGRQVMTVSWTGAHPSGGIVGNVSALEAWTSTEYPMVVLQCRGDDSSADAAVHISPQTCWTTYGQNERRLGGGAAGGGDIYQHDKYAADADKVDSVPSADDWASVCGDGEPAGYAEWPKRIVPFVAANGKSYWRCGAEGHGYAPEMGTSSALGPNEKAEITRTDGSGFTHVEVRTAAENASLGCSASVPCAVVVIPIMGISCDSPAGACNQEGLRPPGSMYSDQVLAAAAVSGQLWASESNWRNRITIPITVAATDSACKSASGRTTLQLYGSALIAEAAEQWVPAYCGRSDRFVLRINDQVESTAFHNLKVGYGNGVLASYKDDSPSPGTLGYAPIAVTGFAVAFVIDIPDGGGQLQQLKLNPRLLAKLMTGSYWGGNFSAAAIAERPDLANNPRSLQLDPEFVQLNPSLVSKAFSWNLAKLTFSQLMSQSVPSDVMRALTSYIAADPEAAAFLKGTPDPWGMTVNRAYRDIALPVSDWKLADTWVFPGATGCDAKQSMPWFSKVMAPVSEPHRLAQDLLQGTPEAIYLNALVPNTDVCKTSRYPTLPQGSRAMIGLVSLADAKRYALPVASLRTTGTGTDATFVAPTEESLSAAASMMTSSAAGEPFVPDAARLVSSSSAYPGTMVVHAALPLTGLDARTAAADAEFVRIATTEGQSVGAGSGELPAGYLPITSGGSTAPLFAAAQAVRTAVAKQLGAMSGTSAAEKPTSTPLDAGSDVVTTGNPVAGSSPAAGSQVTAADPVAGLPAAAAPAADVPTTVLTPHAAVTGPLRAAVPTGLALAALAGIGLPLLRRTPRGMP